MIFKFLIQILRHPIWTWWVCFYRLYLPLLGIKISSRTFIQYKTYFKCEGEITLGNNFVYSSGDNTNPLCRNIRGSIVASKNGRIIIGNNVSISSGCIWARNAITIGHHVMIGAHCIIMDHDAHSIDYIERRTRKDIKQTVATSPIVIGNDVWIGTNCIVLKGCQIGDRSIIGAGSVVTKNIPSDCVAAGNPCRVIRTLCHSIKKDKNI